MWAWAVANRKIQERESTNTATTRKQLKRDGVNTRCNKKKDLSLRIKKIPSKKKYQDRQERIGEKASKKNRK